MSNEPKPHSMKAALDDCLAHLVKESQTKRINLTDDRGITDFVRRVFMDGWSAYERHVRMKR